MTSNRPYRWTRQVRVSVLVAGLLVACGGSGSPTVTVSVPAIELGPTSNADGVLRPTPNGFSFANFAADSFSSENFGGADLAAMFGSGPEVCATGSDTSCVPTAEANEWAQMVNESRETGHCEGFIVLALQRFAAKESPESSGLTSTAPIVHGIFRGFASQFMDSTRQEAKAWSKQSVKGIVSELVRSLKDGMPDYVLGLYGDIGGHAVLPYSVAFTDADHATIGIYDSNWPGQERQVTVDLAAGTWRFSFDGSDPESDENAWTGGKGGMDLSSLETHTKGTCPFCDGVTTASTSTMLAIRAATPSWTLATSRGQVTPQGTAVEGVSISKVRAVAAKRNEWLVTVDADVMRAKSVRLTLPKGARARIVTPKAISRAVTAATGADFDLTETSISTASATASILLVSGNKKVTATNKSATLSLTDAGVPVNAASSGAVASATTIATKSTGAVATTVGPTTSTSATQTSSSTTSPAATSTPATTVAPTTTPVTAPPTTVNQRPNVTASACTGSASTVTLTLSVSDPENDTVTGPSFAFVSGPTNTMNWGSPSATSPYKWMGGISTPYAPIVLDVTVSDAGGSRTVRKTLTSSNNQWNGIGSCSVS